MCFQQFCSTSFLKMWFTTTERLVIILFYILQNYETQAQKFCEDLPSKFLRIPFLKCNKEIIVMRVQKQGKCQHRCIHLVLLILGLVFIVTAITLDSSILTIGKSLKGITALTQKPIEDYHCSQVCSQPYFILSQSSLCCSNNLPSDCKSKENCYQETIEGYQNEKDQAIRFLAIESGIEIAIIIVFVVYCVKRRKGFAKRVQQVQQIREIQNPLNRNMFQNIDDRFGGQMGSLSKLKQSFLGQGDNVCSICMEGISQKRVIALTCSHCFHSDCIRLWMSEHVTCPVCRAPH